MLTNDYKIERPIYKTPEQPRTQIHEYVNNDKVISLFSQLEKIFIEILSDIKGDTLILMLIELIHAIMLKFHIIRMV